MSIRARATRAQKGESWPPMKLRSSAILGGASVVSPVSTHVGARSDPVGLAPVRAGRHTSPVPKAHVEVHASDQGAPPRVSWRLLWSSLLAKWFRRKWSLRHAKESSPEFACCLPPHTTPPITGGRRCRATIGAAQCFPSECMHLCMPHCIVSPHDCSLLRMHLSRRQSDSSRARWQGTGPRPKVSPPRCSIRSHRSVLE